MASNAAAPTNAPSTSAGASELSADTFDESSAPSTHAPAAGPSGAYRYNDTQKECFGRLRSFNAMYGCCHDPACTHAPAITPVRAPEGTALFYAEEAGAARQRERARVRAALAPPTPPAPPPTPTPPMDAFHVHIALPTPPSTSDILTPTTALLAVIAGVLFVIALK